MNPGFYGQPGGSQGGAKPPPIGFFDSPSSNQPTGGYNQPGFQQNQPGFQQPGYPSNQSTGGFNQSGFPQNQPGFPPTHPPFQQGFSTPAFQPNQPSAPFQQPGFQQGPNQPYAQPGYQQNQPGYYQNQPPYQQNPQQPYNNAYANTNWNVNDYLRQTFMQIDVDRNNFITPNELQQALSRLQPNFNFDQRTVEFILKRFDTNQDYKISLDEFYNVYAYLNDEYATFVLNDMNGNGTIESNELTNTLCTRVGSRLNQQTIQLIVSRVEQMLQSRITFDIFCRVNARFDILSRQYHSQRPPMPIEQFFMQQFFNEFW